MTISERYLQSDETGHLYSAFADFVEESRELTSIDLRAYKLDQMEARLRALLNHRAIDGFDDYIQMLRQSRDERREFERFVTINVTQFFRDPELFAALEQELRRSMRRQRRPLDAWSAGCSTGCEPYSIAMILHALNPSARHRVFATDIDERSLRQARSGSGYVEDDLAPLPQEYKARYTGRNTSTGSYAVSRALRPMVQFGRHDLTTDSYRTGYDLILCRNVAIYFSHATKMKISVGFYDALNPGGLLFVGATESFPGLRDLGFIRKGHQLFQRPERR